MEFSLRYSSSRLDVMRLYARLWRARLWKLHAILFAGATLGIGTLLCAGHPGPLPWIVGACAGMLCIASFVAWPLVAFKPQQRLLVVNADGLRTTIGNRTGSLTWGDVQTVERVGDSVHIIRHNLHAFIVPRVAFGADTELDAFVRDSSTWLAATR